MKKNSVSQTDYTALQTMADDDIDCSDLEEFTDEFLNAAEGFAETPDKELISIRIDRKVLDFYRRNGKGYQTRINAVLRAYAETEEKRRSKLA
jgi:uncharacterized protein (DUF4415 family)